MLSLCPKCKQNQIMIDEIVKCYACGFKTTLIDYVKKIKEIKQQE